jgi:hypothetical protein
MPTVVVKNDKAVDSLRTEYTRLYSPTTTWGDIVSMNLGYPGLRGYWTMSSVDENIDVYDISGHGRTLSCLASPSVPPVSTSILRNSFQAFYTPELVLTSLEYTAPKDASGIVGTTTLIHTNDATTSSEYIALGSIVRNGDYIYLYYRSSDVTPWELQIMEYQISTGTKRYITVCTNTYGSYKIATGYGTYISIIEGRKLLVCDTGDFDETLDAPDYHIYIVDFDANTCTEILTIPQYSDDQGTYYRYERYLQSIATIKDDTGDIHLLVSCVYKDFGIHDNWYDEPYPMGWSVYHKNYTDGTPWTETIYIRDYGAPEVSNSNIYQYAISDNRYFCIFCNYVITPTYWTDKGYLFFSFDILTETLSHEAGGSYTFYPRARKQANEDATNHKIYIELTFNNVNYSTYEFDPVACTLGAAVSSGTVFLSASNTHLYDWDASDDIYRTPDQVLQNNSTRPTNIENQCMLMDDSNNSVWYMDGATLKNYNFGTNTIDSSIATGISSANIGIIHMGNALVLTVVDGSYSLVDYYLVT